MSERLTDSPPPPRPQSYFPPVDPVGEIARKNVRLGMLLLAIVVLIAAGAVVISLVYLQYD